MNARKQASAYPTSTAAKQNWPADRVERRSVGKFALIPYARNARTHSEAQVAQIAASITEWGWTTPAMLVDEADGIVAGHGRVLAARLLGLAEVPVVVARGWSEAQKRAYVLADNKLALNAGWNETLLALELNDLSVSDFDMSLIGFSAEDLIRLEAEHAAGLSDPDDAPEPQAEVVTALGDVWLLGRHRLVCGDCTTRETVDAALAGAKPHLMITDPPYEACQYDPGWRVDRDLSSARGVDRSPTTIGLIGGKRGVCSPAQSHMSGMPVCKPGRSLKAFRKRQASKCVRRSIWNKGQIVISRGHYHFQHEQCYYAVRKGATASWHGDQKQSTVWDIPEATRFRNWPR